MRSILGRPFGLAVLALFSMLAVAAGAGGGGQHGKKGRGRPVRRAAREWNASRLPSPSCAPPRSPDFGGSTPIFSLPKRRGLSRCANRGSRPQFCPSWPARQSLMRDARGFLTRWRKRCKRPELARLRGRDKREDERRGPRRLPERAERDDIINELSQDLVPGSMQVLCISKPRVIGHPGSCRRNGRCRLPYMISPPAVRLIAAWSSGCSMSSDWASTGSACRNTISPRDA